MVYRKFVCYNNFLGSELFSAISFCRASKLLINISKFWFIFADTMSTKCVRNSSENNISLELWIFCSVLQNTEGFSRPQFLLSTFCHWKSELLITRHIKVVDNYYHKSRCAELVSQHLCNYQALTNITHHCSKFEIN